MSKHCTVACNAPSVGENPVTVQLPPPASGPDVVTTVSPIRIKPPPVAESPGKHEAVEFKEGGVLSPKPTLG